MRDILPALQARLDSGVTTFARCWIVTRRDGVLQGFTDHDEDIVADGVICRAGTGLTSSEATQHLGLAIGGAEFSGALASDTLNENDLAAGHYDAAAVRIYLVDWSEPALNVLLAQGVLGEVRREGDAFSAELRGLSHRLAEEGGRLYTATCAADLGDARCGVDLADPAYRGEGTATALAATSSFHASGLDAFEDGWFTGGRLAWDSGDNAALAIEIKVHRVVAGVVTLTLWQMMPHPIGEGDTFVVTAGCDKRFATCGGRFDNAVNFRGFPHIPGNDFIISYPAPGAGSGGSPSGSA